MPVRKYTRDDLQREFRIPRLPVGVGDAQPGEVLSGRRFSTRELENAEGTMPNRGAVNITPGTSNQAIPEGYHNGAGEVAGDADLVPNNIRDGVDIFGVMGSLVEGGFASLQSGTVDFASSTSEDVTISSVDLSKAFVILSSEAVSPGRANFNSFLGKLTTSTNLRLERISSNANSQRVDWFVVELVSGSVQSISHTFSGTTSDVSITAVDLNKTYIVQSWKGGEDYDAVQPAVRLLNASTIRFEKFNTGATTNPTVEAFVIEGG